MNERIKQLAQAAGLKWKEQPPHFTNTNNPIDFPKSANADLEKFAELIVQECIKHLYLRNIEGFYIFEERKLKEHFGVEQ